MCGGSKFANLGLKVLRKQSQNKANQRIVFVITSNTNRSGFTIPNIDLNPSWQYMPFLIQLIAIKVIYNEHRNLINRITKCVPLPLSPIGESRHNTVIRVLMTVNDTLAPESSQLAEGGNCWVLLHQPGLDYLITVKGHD